VRRKFFDALVHQAIAADRYHLEARQELWRVADTLGCPRDAVIEPIVEATPVEFPKLIDESGTKKPTDGRSVATPAQMRAWAIANGFDVEGYIRLPWSIVRAFEEAHAEPVDRTARPGRHAQADELPEQTLQTVHDPTTRNPTAQNPTARDARQATSELRPILRPTLPEHRPNRRTDRRTDPDDGVPQLEFDRLETPPIGNPVV
jgi:hypothetical protein